VREPPVYRNIVVDPDRSWLNAHAAGNLAVAEMLELRTVPVSGAHVSKDCTASASVPNPIAVNDNFSRIEFDL
jgi:hypothetical protein